MSAASSPLSKPPSTIEGDDVMKTNEFKVERITPKVAKSAKRDVKDEVERTEKRYAEMKPTLDFKRGKHKQQTRAAAYRHLDPLEQKRPMRIKGEDIGALSSLFDLPFDVIVEITGRLHPLDVLSLSTVSKELRENFNPHKNPQLWTAALRSLPVSPPPCPKDINHAQYVKLLFEHPCFGCDTPKAKMIDYALRMAFCKSCFKELVKRGSTIARKMKLDIPTIVFNLIPRSIWNANDGDRPEDGSSHSEDLFYVPDVDQIVQKYRILQNHPVLLQKFIEQQQEYAQTMITTGTEIASWQQDSKDESHNHKCDIADAREKEMKRRLKELGYTDEEFAAMNPYQDDGEEFHRILRQPRPVTYQIWSQAKRRLTSLLEAKREELYLAILRPRLIARVGEFWALWKTMMPDYFPSDSTDLTFAPFKGEVEDMRCVSDMLMDDDGQTPVTRERLLDIVDDLVAEYRRYMAGMKSTFIHRLDNDEETDEDDDLYGMLPFKLLPDSIERLIKKPMEASKIAANEYRLGLATSLFWCNESNTPHLPNPWSLYTTPAGCPGRLTLMTAEQLIRHHREKHADDLWTASSVHHSRKLAMAAEKLLPLLGLADKSVSFEEASSQLDGRLTCECGSPAVKGRRLKFVELMQHLVGELTWTQHVSMRFGTSWDEATAFTPKSCPYELKDDHTLDDICKLVKLLPEQSQQPQQESGSPSKSESNEELIEYQEGLGPAGPAGAPRGQSDQYVFCVPCHHVTEHQARSKIMKSDEAIEYHMRAKHGIEHKPELVVASTYGLEALVLNASGGYMDWSD